MFASFRCEECGQPKGKRRRHLTYCRTCQRALNLVKRLQEPEAQLLAAIYGPAHRVTRALLSLEDKSA